MKTATMTDPKRGSLLRGLAADYMELVKARLTFLVLLSTLVGFVMGSGGGIELGLMIHTLFATALVAGGAASLNQWLEREADAKMQRTRNRPLPSGRMQAQEAVVFGTAVSLIGIIYLAVSVNALASLIAMVTLGAYLFIYTPLKRMTWLNTIIGAVPGAMPPLIGWAGASGGLSADGWVLFAIMFFWQMPHFFAIAWIYRDDYKAAGFPMLPVVDPEGASTGRLSVFHAMALLPISLMPAVLGMAGPVYFLSALVLSCAYLLFAVRFNRRKGRPDAWWLFGASIVYLPILLSIMVFDKLPH
jgi:protoheme IX farnesyltransferase